MTFIAAPLSFVVSMLLLLVGGLGLYEAQGVCTGVCFFDGQMNAAITGVGMVVAGLFTLATALSASSTSSAVAAKGATSVVAKTNVYAELSKSPVPRDLHPGKPPGPWDDDESPGNTPRHS